MMWCTYWYTQSTLILCMLLHPWGSSARMEILALISLYTQSGVHNHYLCMFMFRTTITTTQHNIQHILQYQWLLHSETAVVIVFRAWCGQLHLVDHTPTPLPPSFTNQDSRWIVCDCSRKRESANLYCERGWMQSLLMLQLQYCHYHS